MYIGDKYNLQQILQILWCSKSATWDINPCWMPLGDDSEATSRQSGNEHFARTQWDPSAIAALPLVGNILLIYGLY